MLVNLSKNRNTDTLSISYSNLGGKWIGAKKRT